MAIEGCPSSMQTCSGPEHRRGFCRLALLLVSLAKTPKLITWPGRMLRVSDHAAEHLGRLAEPVALWDGQ